MFGLKESEVSQLVRSVSVVEPDTLDRDAIEERFARSVWSGIAEPGDRTAGLLIAAIGAPAALAALVERQPVEALSVAAGSELTEKDIQLALDRWQPRLSSATSLTALRQAVRFGVRMSVPGDVAWIPGVDDLEQHAPIALWLRGNTAALGGLDRSYW